MKTLVEAARSLVRPVVTIVAMATVSWLVLQGKEVPVQYGLMLDGILAWWFFDRSRLNKARP